MPAVGQGVLDAGLCGPPEIFNTDQGSQFTSLEFTAVLKDAGVAISMDGRGRCMDNVFIERLWRSLKYEAVYLHERTDGFAAQRTIANWTTSGAPVSVPSDNLQFTATAGGAMVAGALYG